MKDIAHHRKFVQKKVLKEARKQSNERKIIPISEGEEIRDKKKLAKNRLNPEFEGDKFDPHHRKPRLLKRINYH